MKTMDADTLRDHIRHIRQDRRVRKLTAAKKRATVAVPMGDKVKRVAKPKNPFAGLSAEQLEALISRIEGNGGKA